MIEGPLPGEKIELIDARNDTVVIEGKQYSGIFYFRTKGYLSYPELASEYFPGEDGFHPLFFFAGQFERDDVDNYIEKDCAKRMSVLHAKDLYSMKDCKLDIRIFCISKDSASVATFPVTYEEYLRKAETIPFSRSNPVMVSLTEIRDSIAPQAKNFPCIFLWDKYFVVGDPATIKIPVSSFRNVFVINSEDFDSLRHLGPQFKIVTLVPKYYDREGFEIALDNCRFFN